MEAQTTLASTEAAQTTIPPTTDALSVEATTPLPPTTETQSTEATTAVTTQQQSATTDVTTTMQRPVTEDSETTTDTSSDIVHVTTQNATKDSTSSDPQTTDDREYTTGKDESTMGSTLGSSGGRINAGDFAAIALGVVLLIAIVLVVTGIIAYKKGVCGGPRKKGMMLERERESE